MRTAVRRDSRYVELKAFFEIVTDLLEGPESVFSFWNGLGATSESRLLLPLANGPGGFVFPLESLQLVQCITDGRLDR